MVAALERSTELAKSGGSLGVAAEHTTERVPVARREQRAGEVRGQLAGRQFDCAEDVAVVESDTLVGLVSIERLLAADENASLRGDHGPRPAAGRAGHRPGARRAGRSIAMGAAWPSWTPAGASWG